MTSLFCPLLLLDKMVFKLLNHYKKIREDMFVLSINFFITHQIIFPTVWLLIQSRSHFHLSAVSPFLYQALDNF